MSRHPTRTRVLSVTNLAAALFEHAAGRLADTAAVNLLIGHGIWLSHPDFQHEFVRTGRCHPTCAPTAYIRWRAAVTALNQHRLPCSGSEADLLRIAASLATDQPLRLRAVLGNFDDRNIGLVTDAIALANGTEPHHCF